MKKFAMTFKVECTETVYIQAESEAAALAMLDENSDYDDDVFKTITNLKYDGTLVEIKEYK